jgi:hypothetical protein
MSTATNTSTDTNTGKHTPAQSRQRETQKPVAPPRTGSARRLWAT